MAVIQVETISNYTKEKVLGFCYLTTETAKIEKQLDLQAGAIKLELSEKWLHVIVLDLQRFKHTHIIRLKLKSPISWIVQNIRYRLRSTENVS